MTTKLVLGSLMAANFSVPVHLIRAVVVFYVVFYFVVILVSKLPPHDINLSNIFTSWKSEHLPQLWNLFSSNWINNYQTNIENCQTNMWRRTHTYLGDLQEYPSWCHLLDRVSRCCYLGIRCLFTAKSLLTLLYRAFVLRRLVSLNNYICNQFLSSLKLWVRILIMDKGTRDNIMW
jgi:hypothetical protein